MKNERKTYTVVDAGNTHIRVVDFLEENIVYDKVIPNSEVELITSHLLERQNNTSILSSVLSKTDREKIEKILHPTIVLTQDTPLPIRLDGYKTIETLGTDRIANAVAADHFSETNAAVVIDAGTCITFDIVANKQYEGGSISPGYQMRMKAMNEFTGSLPMVDLAEVDYWIGRTTKESMLSGVMNGVQAEINGFLMHYEEKYPLLTIFLTGGDHKRFDIARKNSIFVDNNLTIKGLFIILKHNV